MGKLTLDAELRAKLNGLNEPLEVCDESGRTLGHFLPANLYREWAYAWAKAQFADQAEREQARQEIRSEGGLTTAEAVACLEQVARAAGRES